MRLLLKGLPGDMEVMLDTGDGIIVSVCSENSGILELPLLDGNGEDFEDDDPINDFHEYDLGEDDDEEETIEILLLVPCNHVCEVEQGELNSQPELN